MTAAGNHWVHNLDPVIFRITDALAVRWYGLSYVLAFICAFGLLHWYWKRGRSPVGPAHLESLFMALVVGVVVGGRLGYFLLYEPAAFARNPLVFFKFWEGGMASHGGFAGVTLAILWGARRCGVPALRLGDLVATTVPPGLFFGRVANFINGELWGKATDVPWAVVFPQSAPPGWPVELIAPRHPSQLYQAGLEGLALLAYMQWRFWSVPDRPAADPAATRRSARPGHLAGEFLIAYSLLRAAGEIFREPDAPLILGLSRGTFYSAFLLAAGLGMVLWIRSGRLTKRQSR